MTGQEAVNVAQNFDAQIGLTGLILTKLDGDSRGGSALSVVHCTGKPIKLTGTGEKLNALEDFYPERMATRILGMGDIVSLVERAQEVFDEKEALKMQEKMQKAEFSFNDFLNMQKQMKMFGSMDQLLGMLPGVNLKQADREKISHATDTEFKRIEVFIQSMTPEERENPQLINTSRKKRIAKGCGMDMHTINIYIKQFEQMRQMMGGMGKMQKMFGGFGKQNNKKAMVQAMNAMKMMKRRFK
jgi:signal recognition particle subunit SRP54